MDSFVTRKRSHEAAFATPRVGNKEEEVIEEDSTEVKLAMLSSLHPEIDSTLLLETLLAAEGSVERASETLSSQTPEKSPTKKRTSNTTVGYQSSLTSFQTGGPQTSPKKPLAQKGKTLHLFSPEDVAAHTPCSIIHNFLPAAQADALLKELLAESKTFTRETFKLFDNVVTSGHTVSFYVDDWDSVRAQRTEYIYNGSRVTDVRKTTPELSAAAPLVQAAVNAEIRHRIATRYPDGKKLRFQSPAEWTPNTAFVNCYDGGKESVGWHSDQMTYLGPRAVIGSVSLGVAREFRVRRITPAGDAPQIAIHLPHNSLLVMHAEMQEEWKHSVAPAAAIDPHPVAGSKRFNITYRCYRPSLHPRLTPKCKCGVPTVLRCVQRKEGNRGRYMWMCHAHYTPGKEGCGFFQWAEFDDDGEPIWERGKETAEKAGAAEK